MHVCGNVAGVTGKDASTPCNAFPGTRTHTHKHSHTHSHIYYRTHRRRATLFVVSTRAGTRWGVQGARIDVGGPLDTARLPLVVCHVLPVAPSPPKNHSSDSRDTIGCVVTEAARTAVL